MPCLLNECLIDMVTQGAGSISRAKGFVRASPAIFAVSPIDMLKTVTMNAQIGERLSFGTKKGIVGTIEGKGVDGINPFVVLTSIVRHRNMGINAGSGEGMEERACAVALVGAYRFDFSRNLNRDL